MGAQTKTTDSRRDRYFYCLIAAPVVLCVVAGVQVVRVLWCDQSPWKGGGFGMFATNDNPGARFAKVYLLTKDGEVPATLPPLREAAVLRTAPTADNLERVAERLCTETWVRNRKGPYTACAVCGTSEPTGEASIDYSAIRVELWRYAFEPQTNQLRASKYRETIKTRTGT